VVIKIGLGRRDFQVDAQRLRQGLLFHGYEELAISGAHTLAVRQNLTPLIVDKELGAYGPPCGLV
jgi:hypothetical protein